MMNNNMMSLMQRYSSLMNAGQWGRQQQNMSPVWNANYLYNTYGGAYNQGMMSAPRVDVTNFNSNITAPPTPTVTPPSYYNNQVINVPTPPSQAPTTQPKPAQTQTGETDMVWDPRTGAWTSVKKGDSAYGGNAGPVNKTGTPNPYKLDMGGSTTIWKDPGAINF